MVLILNDIGTWEILLILAFVLIFFGAKSIPGLARTFGRTIRQVKEASAEIQNEIRKSSEEMKGDLNLKGIIEDTAEDIKRPLDQYAQDIDDAVKYQPPNKRSTLKPVESQDTPESIETEEIPEKSDVPQEEKKAEKTSEESEK